MSTQEKIEEILDGIDKTEIEYNNGWWATSVGAEFGAKKKQELQALIESAKREGYNDAIMFARKCCAGGQNCDYEALLKQSEESDRLHS